MLPSACGGIEGGVLAARTTNMNITMHSTTILGVKRDGKVAIAGDGQVTLDKTVMKSTARKIRRLYDGKVLTGFAGSAADAQALADRFESKLETANGNLRRAVIDFAKEWRPSDSLPRV